MRTRQKKAEVSFLTVIIVTLIVIVVIGAVMLKAGIIFGSKVDRETCRNSVVLASARLAGVTGLPVELQCKTNYLLFKDKGIYIDNRKLTDTDNYDSMGDWAEVQDKTKMVIANQMRDCWYEFGEGTLDVFPLGKYTTQKHCVVCTRIKFDDSFKNKAKEDKIVGIVDWLKNNKIDKDTTYLDYLQKRVQATEHPFLFWYREKSYSTLDILDEFDLTKKYDIIYLLYTPEWSELPQLGDILKLKHQDQKAILVVVEEENLKDLKCDQMY